MANLPRKKLPIGIQTFSTIREEGYYYVDKTPHIHRLVEEGKYYFLSRPRRFGKSLLLDTLDCLFSGRKKLFECLFIEDRWDWAKKHPVVRISFGSGVLTSRVQLDERIREQLFVNRQQFGVELERETDIPGEFASLIRQAHQQSGQRVAVLIDEYDKPILDNILEPERARELREGLKNLSCYWKFYNVTT